MQGFFAGFYAFAYLAGSFVCHQLPDRSFHLAGVQLPVCARCTGLYGGAIAGFLMWGAWRLVRSRPVTLDRKRVLILLAVTAAPTFMTLATGTIGVWDPSNLGRAVAGLPLGLVAGAMVAAMVSKDLR